MKTRGRLLLIAMLVFSMVLTGCGKENAAPTDPGTETPEQAVAERAEDSVSGQSGKLEMPEADPGVNLSEQSRIQNDGNFLVEGGWIYGQSWDKEGNSLFVKARADYSDWMVLDEGFAMGITRVDNYLYYVQMAEPMGIYRMKLSGEDKQLLVPNGYELQIVGDSMYYTLGTEDGTFDMGPEYDSYFHLYRSDLDGENAVKILEKPVFYAYVFEDWILYQDDRDNMSLHICGLDGSSDEKLNDVPSFFPLYDGEYIYYITADAPGAELYEIRKIRRDGSEDQRVSDCYASNSFLLTQEHIYFVNPEDRDRLYRMDKDGGNVTLITQDDHVAYVMLFGDVLKYTVYDGDYAFMEGNYFCQLDGSGKRAFEK